MKKVIALFLVFVLSVFMVIPANAVEVKAGKKLLIVPDNVTSKQIKKGDIICGEVKNDVVVDSKVVIRQGAPARLYVNDVQRAHRWGVAGYITLTRGSVEDITGEEREVFLDYEVKGDEKDWVKITASLSIATIILAPLGLLALIKGGEAELQYLNVIDAELINDFSI